MQPESEMMQRGRFITVEGGEGVGKSTNISFIRDLLEQDGHSVVVSREPGGTALSEQIRSLLLDATQTDMSAMTELLLIFAARAQHLDERILPALASGQWVLCDRFTDATYAYQGGGRGFDETLIAQLETLVQGELRPDLTLVLDIDPEEGMARARERAALDRFEQEKLAFFARVRDNYRRRAEASERHVLIDASQPLSEVQSGIRCQLQKFLERTRQKVSS